MKEVKTCIPPHPFLGKKDNIGRELGKLDTSKCSEVIRLMILGLAFMFFRMSRPVCVYLEAVENKTTPYTKV